MAQLKPKDSYICQSDADLTDETTYALIACYLPIVGPLAVSLYQFFSYQKKLFKEGPHLHGEILNHLNIGLNDFLEGRQKLEALGLLETFWHETEGYYYHVKRPLTCKAFLQDEIFTQLLINRIGEETVLELASFQKEVVENKKDYVPLTVNFQAVYPLSLETMEANKKVTEKIQNELSSQLEKNSTFDWIFFKDVIEKQGISISRFNRDEKEELVKIVEMYGMDELSLAHLVVASSDLLSGEFHLKKMKELLMDSFNTTLSTKANEPKEEVKEKERRQQLKEKGFSNHEIQFIFAVEAYTPLQFLKISKENLGGYITNEEQRIIENLYEKKVFPSSVINILIDYVLRMNKNGSLSKSYVDRIANNWAQEKIQSPEEAILKVRAVIKEASQPKTNKKAPLQVKEKLPDWVKKPVKETKVDKDKAKAFEDKIKELREKRGEKK